MLMPREARQILKGMRAEKSPVGSDAIIVPPSLSLTFVW